MYENFDDANFRQWANEFANFRASPQQLHDYADSLKGTPQERVSADAFLRSFVEDKGIKFPNADPSWVKRFWQSAEIIRERFYQANEATTPAD